MSFRFALAPLLRLRQSIERQGALDLQKANLAVNCVREKLEQLDRFLAASGEADQAELSTGRSAAELQFVSLTRDNLRRVRQQFQIEIKRLEIESQRATVKYQRAYRDREALETLRSSHKRAYQQEELRREQREVDAAHLLRRWHTSNG